MDVFSVVDMFQKHSQQQHNTRHVHGNSQHDYNEVLQSTSIAAADLAIHGEHGGLGVGAAHELHKAAALASWDLHVHNLAKSLKDCPQLVLRHLRREHRM